MSVGGILNAVHVRPCRLLLQYQQQMLTVTGNAWVIMGGDEVQRPALAESLAKRDRWLFHRLPTSLYRRREETPTRHLTTYIRPRHTTYHTRHTRHDVNSPFSLYIFTVFSYNLSTHFRHPAQPLRDSRSRHPSLPTYLVTQRLLTPVCTQPTTTYRNVL